MQILRTEKIVPLHRDSEKPMNCSEVLTKI